MADPFTMSLPIPSASSSPAPTPPLPSNTDQNPRKQQQQQQQYPVQLPLQTLESSTSFTPPDRSPTTLDAIVDEYSSSTMSSTEPSGHRRRRSSLMNNIDGSAPRKHRHTRSQRSQGKITEHDQLLEESRASEDESKSTSEDFELNHLSDDDLQDDEETGLTTADKQKRRGRRRQNTMLDQRVVADTKITAEEKKAADQSVVKNSVVNGILIGLWYLFSLSISIYNKWMFSPDHLNFHYPLFTTCMHMLVQFTLAGLVLYFFPGFRPNRGPSNDVSHATEYSQPGEEEKRPIMTKMFYLTRLGPCGLATGLDIGLGNMSLKTITLTFYTMCKSSSLAFVLIFAFLFRLESVSWRLIAIIATMTAGVLMMVAGEVNFKPLGFFLVISASFFSGFRWALTQILLLRNPATSNPFSSIFFLAPVMFFSLLIIAIPVEGPANLAYGLHVLMVNKGPVLGPLVLLFPGCLAFLMTASEFALLKRTSVVTLSICGIFKEVVTISAAGIVFHDPLTPINVSGLLVTMAAIAAYNYIKISKMRADARAEAHLQHAHTVDGEHDGSDADGEDEGWLTGQEDGLVTSDGEMLPKQKIVGESSRTRETGEASGRELSD